MSLDENKELVRRFIAEVFDAGRVEAIAGFCVPGSLLAGGLGGQVQAMKTAFPDSQITVEQLVAEGDTVVAQVAQQGTNSGPMLGLPGFGRLEQPAPPTGQTVLTSGIFVFTLRDGRVLSLAQEVDTLGMLRQLGWTVAPPAPAGAG